MTTVREFCEDCYQLVSASNPTVPLHGNDLEKSIRCLNRILKSYASTGLLLTIAKTTSVPLLTGQQDVVCGPPTYLPTPDITLGRMANIENAWLTLSGVTYPLINPSKDDFLAAWKYEPLQGLPRFIITFPETEVVRLRLYPAPSQFFTFNLRAKFQLTTLTSNDTMVSLPEYYERYLTFAVAKDIAVFKGRAAAWTPLLEDMLVESRLLMEAASEVNLSITGDNASLLNGAWRVRAGI